MDAARCEEFRRGHGALLAALERLGGTPAAPAVEHFLLHDAPVLEQWLRQEEIEIFGALDTLLPLEAEVGAALRRENETARSLLGLLRRAHAGLQQGAPWAEAQLANTVQDLALLLRDHFRKEDGVICRLLEILPGEVRE